MWHSLVAVRVAAKHDADVGGVVVGGGDELEVGVGGPRVEGSL